MVVATRDPDVAAEMADEVVVVHHGEVVEAGTAERVLQRPRHPQTAALLRGRRSA